MRTQKYEVSPQLLFPAAPLTPGSLQLVCDPFLTCRGSGQNNRSVGNLRLYIVRVKRLIQSIVP